MTRWIACLLLFTGVATSGAAEPPAQFSAEDLSFFETKVRPVLTERCGECHGASRQKGHLRLDSRAAALAGGDTGPAVVPGHPEESELLSAVSYDPSGYQMPPSGKLSDAEIASLTEWVARGAPWPADATGPAAGGKPSWAEEFARRRRHWSFQPLTRPALPTVEERDWCLNPIDRFIAARREQAQLTHAVDADRRAWLRRTAFDVLGLPPTVADLEAFLEDAEPGAEERAIDRLLASPHFGERWGRHWLDLVRYAESRGHEFDYDVANPWPYRDYVIRAVNADIPFDQFVVEHVAGDLLSESDAVAAVRPNQPPVPHYLRRRDALSGADESILGTGFWYLGEWVHSPVDIRQEEADRFENMIDVYSKAFLGLTVACARCHDHKFDPIPQSDFYALQGYLQSSVYAQELYETRKHNAKITAELEALQRTASEQLLSVLSHASQPVVEKLGAYLLAAADVLARHAKALEGPSTDWTPDVQNHIRSIASEKGLTNRTLTYWVEHLRYASQHPDDPFATWAELATGRLENVPSAVRQLEARYDKDVADITAWYEIFDDAAASFSASDFYSDGAAYSKADYGLAISSLGADAEQPVGEICSFEFAEYLPEAGELPCAESAMQEPGRLSALARAGRTLRTPSFEITRDKICCLIRGDCFTYVVVDSHSLINGPLHGSLIKEHKSPAGETDAGWRWVEHDVARYKGHRAHLEFIPRQGGRFAAADVHLLDKRPPIDATVVSTAVGTYPTLVESKNREELAEAYQANWKSLKTESVAENYEFWAPADWARRHPQLFELDLPAARREFAKTAAPLMQKRIELVKQYRSGSQLAPVMHDGTGEEEYIFIRGAWKKRGETAPRQFLTVFGGKPAVPPTYPSTVVAWEGQETGTSITFGELANADPNGGSGRLELAIQMVNPQQTPILARVIVNRLWLHYFGRGLVSTPDDFGHLGLPPSHPELLDWLASELIAHNWSLKHIHRLILSSRTYRMASDPPQPAPERCLAEDPSNTLLWRMNVKRLEGEIIRDAVLQLSGSLDEAMFGRSVPVHLTAFLEGRGRPSESGPLDGRGRRSVYIAVRRNFAEPFFQAFDFPNPHSCIGRRNVSNVPAQALALLNNPMILEQTRLWSRRFTARQANESTPDRIAQLYEEIYSRPPTDAEREAGCRFIAEQSAPGSGDASTAWADYVHVLINAKEFVFIR